MEKTIVRALEGDREAFARLYDCYAPRALAAEIKAQVAAIVEALFPPKDIEVSSEGESEMIPHEPVVEQQATAENGLADFMIYMDPSRYFLEATEGHGIRFAAMVETFEIVPEDAQ